MRSAAGDPAAEASVLLLAHAGHWLHELAVAGLIAVDYDDTSVPGCRPRVGWAAVTWIDVEAAVRTGQIVGSGGQLRVLRAAASLAAGHPADLGDIVSGLDDRHLVLLLAAIAHVGGSHELGEERKGAVHGAASLRDGMPSMIAWPPRD